MDGIVEGPVKLADGTLTVGGKGTVKGDVVVRETIVHGAVTGNVQARDRVEIKQSGSVVGDLTTSRIIIDDGAHYKGSIEIGRK